MKIGEHLNIRYKLTIDEYDRVIDENAEWLFGIKDKEVEYSKFIKYIITSLKEKII